MTSNRFFLNIQFIRSSEVFLRGDEHHHLSKVARVKPKQKVWLFDGKGSEYLARVEEIASENTRLRILKQKKETYPPVKITLAQALIKSKNMELILQKATEWGIFHIIPVITARSVVKTENKVNKKKERWKRIIKEAAKQSGGTFLPSLSTPQKLSPLINREYQDKKLFLSEKGEKSLKEVLLSLSNSREKEISSVLILIGPEGGWTEGEEKDILNHGFESISLGSRILRTETASICSIAMITHFINY